MINVLYLQSEDAEHTYLVVVEEGASLLRGGKNIGYVIVTLLQSLKKFLIKVCVVFFFFSS